MEIHGYTDLYEIGHGGFAVVYRARQTAFGRDVAIKVLNSPGLSDVDRTRFEREALTMGQLSWHPHIVVVHDSGITAIGQPYLVMEYLEGGSLGDRVAASGPLPHAEAVKHAIRLCSAVHTAHEAGLLHRDVKPDNALIDALGRAKLADFGIAAVKGSTLTATGLVTATYAHAAPEVLNGQRATFAADVYSLGSTLFALLAGHSAFERDTDESIVPLVIRATSGPVPDLRSEGVPDAIAEAIEWSMAKAAEDRPPSALELGQVLQDAERSLGFPVTEMPMRTPTAAAEPEARGTVSRRPVPVTPVETPSAQPSLDTLGVGRGPTLAGDRLGPLGPAPGVGPALEERSGRGRRTARALVGGAVVIAAVVAGVLLLQKKDDSGDGAQAPGEQEAPDTTVLVGALSGSEPSTVRLPGDRDAARVHLARLDRNQTATLFVEANDRFVPRIDVTGPDGEAVDIAPLALGNRGAAVTFRSGAAGRYTVSVSSFEPDQRSYDVALRRDTRFVAPEDLAVGDCVSRVGEETWGSASGFLAVGCGQPHDGQVFEVVQDFGRGEGAAHDRCDEARSQRIRLGGYINWWAYWGNTLTCVARAPGNSDLRTSIVAS